MAITLAIVLIRALHAAYVIFVVCAPVLVLSGVLLSLRRLYGRWVCALHACAVVFVALQHALGWSCPLTEAENSLRGLPPGTAFLAGVPPIATSTVVTVVVAYLALSVLAHLLAHRARRA